MQTVFIVGAGASHEAGLPVGNKLTEIIANRLNFKFDWPNGQKGGSTRIKDAFDWGKKKNDARCSDLDALVRAAHIIRDAMPLAPSIDNFIHTHNNNKLIELCGKLAIAEAILEAERSSKLFFKQESRGSTINFEAIKGTWYAGFARILIANGTIAELQQRLSEITLIVFNYDRCIEHYLFHALQTYYRLSEEQSAELIRSIKIIHPYGSVGNLPWYQADARINYGENCGGEKLFQLASELRTFTEGADKGTTQIEVARSRLREANLVVFLGFAFHSLNLNLLFPPSEPFPRDVALRVFATAKDFSIGDRGAIRDRLQDRFKSNDLRLQMDDWTCNELFQNNQIGLSLA